MEPALQNSAIREALGGQVAIFAGLPDAGLEQAIGLARREKREKGQILFHQGEPADAFHLVLAGCIRVDRRIAHALGRLVVQAGRRTAGGIEIDFPIGRQDLAEMTGTTLHTVSRTLSAWESAGIVLGGRRRVAIAQPHALAAIAEDVPEKAT